MREHRSLKIVRCSHRATRMLARYEGGEARSGTRYRSSTSHALTGRRSVPPVSAFVPLLMALSETSGA